VTARQQIAATRVAFGFALYRSGGIGSAVKNWELALAEDPTLIYALPFLTRGYYDLGRYESGVATAKRLAALIKDHSYAVADVYSIAGDCYTKLGDNVQARHFYQLSLIADPILNYWALTRLAGE
jgi:tetratricopeptide (TPR) repeat protein